MSENNDDKIYLPTLEESIWALDIASEVKDLIDNFASTGKLDPNLLISIGHALFELSGEIRGAKELYERVDELRELSMVIDSNELSSYSNYYGLVTYKDGCKVVTMQHFEKDEPK